MKELNIHNCDPEAGRHQALRSEYCPRPEVHGGQAVLDDILEIARLALENQVTFEPHQGVRDQVQSSSDTQSWVASATTYQVPSVSLRERWGVRRYKLAQGGVGDAEVIRLVHEVAEETAESHKVISLDRLTVSSLGDLSTLTYKKQNRQTRINNMYLETEDRPATLYDLESIAQTFRRLLDIATQPADTELYRGRAEYLEAINIEEALTIVDLVESLIYNGVSLRPSVDMRLVGQVETLERRMLTTRRLPRGVLNKTYRAGIDEDIATGHKIYRFGVAYELMDDNKTPTRMNGSEVEIIVQKSDQVLVAYSDLKDDFNLVEGSRGILSRFSLGVISDEISELLRLDNVVDE